MHAAVKACRQPGRESRFGGGQVDSGDPDLGQSERAGPAPQFFDQQRTIDLSTSGQHQAIVGSASDTGPARTVPWHDEADTAEFAARLAACPAVRNACIALHGDLGAGKTSFVRHLLRALGATGRIKSPTYAVVEPHELPGLAAWHFDFYRFDDPREWEDAGFRELFASPGLKLVEWPEKAAGQMPPPDLELWIAIDEPAPGPEPAARADPAGDEALSTEAPRTVRLQARGATGRALLEAIG